MLPAPFIFAVTGVGGTRFAHRQGRVLRIEWMIVLATLPLEISANESVATSIHHLILDT
jgi:hypothetical protein